MNLSSFIEQMKADDTLPAEQMYVTVPKETPNRAEPTSSTNIIEVIQNVVDKIEGITVHFQDTFFTLRGFVTMPNYNKAVGMSNNLANTLPSEFDELISILKKELSNNGHSPTIELINSEYAPQGNTTSLCGALTFIVENTYELK